MAVAGAALALAQRDEKPMIGKLVKVVSSIQRARRVDEASLQETEEFVNLAGETLGCCIAWLESSQTYVLQSFNGSFASFAEQELEEWSPPPAEEGGFDVAWPVIDRGQPGKATMHFAEAVSNALADKGYCFIQTFTSDEDREAAWESAQDEDREFFRMKQEVETGYMGFDSNNKVAWLKDEASNPDELRYPDLDDSAFENCHKNMEDLGSALQNSVKHLNISYNYVMNPLLRVSMTKNEEEDYLPESVRDMMSDPDGSWTLPIQEYLYWTRRRRLCAMQLFKSEGGHIWFYPKDQAFLAGGRTSMRVPATENKLLIFRHDIMDYSYQVRGRSLALQAWFMQDIGKSQAINELFVNLGQLGDVGKVVCNPGPEVPEGPKASIMALTTRMPGEAWTPSQYWCMFSMGTDAISQWPSARWELDLYYEEGADSVATGKSYTCHGGFVSQEQITQFDNEFFGLDHMEAKSMLPAQKMCLEVGYECLVHSGFNKQSLNGRRIGSWFGDVGPDWHSFQTEWPRFCPDVPATMMSTSMSCAGTAGRIAHIFNLRGAVSSYDTACSASLVAMNAAHLCMFDAEKPTTDNSEHLIVGVNTLLGPASFIGNCMATMLSHVGRCFTFNRAADGYQRGEGAAGVFLKTFAGDESDIENRACALIGTATNQDGRSASLTAPNGPAQQAVIRKSMRFAGINPHMVSIAECHGTGTALGDPIEVGALQAVMSDRTTPILQTSAKSNVAHLEAGAGIAGLTKCIMMVNMGTAPPNCHFNTINAHLSVEGYPVYFDTEDIDVGLSSLYNGVSSFGFGGTNSRADVYGECSRGHKSIVKANLPTVSLPKAMHIGQPIYIKGSWDDFSSYKAMDGGRYGTYSCAVALGDSRWEEFHLCCSKDDVEVIHPLVKHAESTDQIVGPDYAGKGLNFLIDGRKDGMPPGTIYQIDFTWTDDEKSISWMPLESSLEDLEVIQENEDVEHKYYLSGTWRKFTKNGQELQEMKKVDDGIYEAGFVIRYNNFEEFQIVRDKDFNEVIYPSVSGTSKAGVPVQGPDWNGKGKCWRVNGKMHEEVVVRLQIVAGQASVTVRCPSYGERKWLSWDEWSVQNVQTFHAVSSGQSTPMVSESPGLHTCDVKSDEDGYMSFRIVVDNDEQLSLYPDFRLALCGPDPDGADQAWHIHGSRHSTYRLTLDFTGSDRMKMVTWQPLSEQAALTA